MKNLFTVSMGLFLMVLFVVPGFAQAKDYTIEVLQVTDIDGFNMCLNGFKDQLAKNGIVEGKDYTINRRIVHFDVENSTMEDKIALVKQIKEEAAKIVNARPDLVLTIGTSPTKYAKDAIISAGIPLVFTGVAIPQAAGCKSLTEAGPGFTGATLWMDMKNVNEIFHLAFPAIKTVGIIYSDDANAVAQVEEAKKYASAYGLTFITKQVDKKDDVRPFARELMDQGVEIFWLPLDTYYGVRNSREFKSLCEETISRDMFIFSLTQINTRGGIMAVGSDFRTIGSYSGQQAAKILAGGVKPDDLPILTQEDLMIRIDERLTKTYKLTFPMELLTVAKAID